MMKGWRCIAVCLFFSAISVPRGFCETQDAAVQKISSNLDSVLKTQQDIIQRLSEMKEELYVIKIRASR